MVTIPQLATSMHHILKTAAARTERESGFVQRRSKLSDGLFVQTLVFAWLNDPNASYTQLAQMAATLGTPVSPQALAQRFTPQAADYLRRVLEATLTQVLHADPVAIPLLQRFQGVYVQDSTTLTLPDELASLWPGCGGRTPHGTQAALKVQVQLNLLDGELTHLDLQPGRAQDRSAPMQHAPLPPGALRLADLGYLSLPVLADYAAQGVFWLSRYPSQCSVFSADGEPLDLVRWLQRSDDLIDQPIQLGADQRLPCRLIARRVPPQVAAQRRRKLNAEARREGRQVRARQLALQAWTILITNAPPTQLSAEEALVLARLRWQIELVFKLWKSAGQVDTSRSAQPYRILCEVYAKLLAMVLQHWVMLTCCWQEAGRSLTKAAHLIRQHAVTLALCFHRSKRLCEALAVIQRCLAVGAKMNPRRKSPNTYQLLLAFSNAPQN